ncbi:SOS response-associated peptidase [Chitinimonas taiwanensis]|uniref:SOS response-associated peptidase n=1 Tax=Chitinimonas taiwanensis TaxID=240412 RepID=UPI0035B34C50
MCTSYQAPAPEALIDAFEIGVPGDTYRRDVHIGYLSPILRLAAGSDTQLSCAMARFGLIPAWAEDAKIGRHTYNARSETVAEKPSFKQAWRQGQFCLVPMCGFYEPNYESGKPVRWRIARSDEAIFTAAGIWDVWQHQGERVLSFSLLTIHADGHPLMGRFHRPGDEKRSLVIIPKQRQLAWLKASPQMARTMLSLAPLAEFTAHDAADRPQNLSLF